VIFSGGYRWSASLNYRTLYYQVDADSWYLGPEQYASNSMAYGSAAVLPGTDLLVVWGGYLADSTGTPAYMNPCFSQDFQVLDLGKYKKKKKAFQVSLFTYLFDDFVFFFFFLIFMMDSLWEMVLCQHHVGCFRPTTKGSHNDPTKQQSCYLWRFKWFYKE
jgi:hypothetical protein